MELSTTPVAGRAKLVWRAFRENREHPRHHVHQIEFELAVETTAAHTNERQNLDLVGLPERLHRAENVRKIGTNVLFDGLYQIVKEENCAVETRSIALLALHHANERGNHQREVLEGTK